MGSPVSMTDPVSQLSGQRDRDIGRITSNYKDFHELTPQVGLQLSVCADIL
jgi:hypothetical protein